ncbi:DUF2177 family protein [Lacipirellula sp.]|uniref:DUF2177 family protein n=1 Tax=Lacipirellula sp. TaxID=2691419 RepID=UPI003D14CD2E
MQSLKIFAIVAPVCMAIDLLWLGVIMKDFYSSELGELARRQAGGLSPRWPAAILVYLLIPAGIVIFVRPLLQVDSSWAHTAGIGALFGFIVYGVYDLTNRAVLENYSLRLTIADILWGCVLCALTSCVMRAAMRWIA